MVEAGSILHRILVWLKARAEHSWTAKQIALGTGINPSTIRVYLRRAARSTPPLIANPIYGRYQDPEGLVRRGAIDPRLRVHGLKFECRCNKTMGWPYLRLSKIVTTRFPSPTMHIHPRNHSLTTYGDWKGRPITITAHPDETVLLEVFMEASQDPLNVLELFGFLDNWLHGAFGIPGELWMIRQVDWNIDELGSVADLGLTGLSVAQGRELVAKVYQKAHDTLRSEIRDFRPLSTERLLGNMRAILRSMEELAR